MTKKMHKASVIPIYGIAMTWLVFGVVAPLYTVSRYVLCAVISFGVFMVLKLVFPGKDVVVEVPEPEPDTGNPELDRVIKNGRASIAQMKQLNQKIPDVSITQKLDSMEAITAKIFAYVEKHSEKLNQIQTFLDYYLPTTLKLLNAYVELQEQGVEGENITKAKQSIAGMLDTVQLAFQKQLDALFESTNVDITADIQVMERMMAANGLTGQKDF